MNEAELIKRFRELDAKIPQQKSRMKYAEDKTTYLKELELLQKDQEYTISLLKGCADKSSTFNKVEKVKSILNHLYAKFSKTDYQYKFSRDQGLIVHGFLLIKIIEDISYAFDHDTVSISEYYFDSMSDFNCDELNQVLKMSIAYFSDHKFNDYIELFEYVRSIQKKITSLDPECGTMKI